MNILFVIDSLTYGGAETQVIALAKELSCRGHEVTIFSLAEIVPRAGELDGSGVHLIAGNLRYPLDPGVICRLRACVRDRAIHVVQGVLFDGDFYSRLAVLGTRAFLINSERNWNYGFQTIQTIGHYLTRARVDCLVANTHSGLDFASQRYNLAPSNMHAVWNGIDLRAVDARLTQSPSPTRSFFDGSVKVAAFVGSLKRSKDVLFALDAAEELVGRDDSWRVLFMGSRLERFPGPYSRLVEKRYARIPHKNRIRFIGNRNDALEIIAGSEILFSTSVNEGFPNVVLEAMAVGTPVVSSNYSDISLILDRDQIVLSRNAVEYVDRLQAVYADSNAVIARQRRFVEENCDIEMIVSAYEAIYKDGAKHSGR